VRVLWGVVVSGGEWWERSEMVFSCDGKW